jgi:hypothetical protein
VSADTKINVSGQCAGVKYAIKSSTPSDSDTHPVVSIYGDPPDIFAGETFYVYGPCSLIWSVAL